MIFTKHLNKKKPFVQSNWRTGGINSAHICTIKCSLLTKTEKGLILGMSSYHKQCHSRRCGRGTVAFRRISLNHQDIHHPLGIWTIARIQFKCDCIRGRVCIPYIIKNKQTNRMWIILDFGWKLNEKRNIRWIFFSFWMRNTGTFDVVFILVVVAIKLKLTWSEVQLHLDGSSSLPFSQSSYPSHTAVKSKQSPCSPKHSNSFSLHFGLLIFSAKSVWVFFCYKNETWFVHTDCTFSQSNVIELKLT